MSLRDYLKSKFNIIVLNFLLMIFLAMFLFSAGNNFYTIKVIIVSWIIIFIITIVYGYRRRKVYFSKLLKSVDNIDKKYLISEVIDAPIFYDAVPYYILMKKARKSMLEELTEVKNQRKDYKEYIEQWVHEVKTPISSIKLIEENNKTNTSRRVLQELSDIDRCVEQALFYARSEEVEKDYLIREISLEECVNKVLIRNKQMFILNNIEVQLDDLDVNVYCDMKWLEFIINQIVVNSIKYRNKEDSKVKIYSSNVKNGKRLIIEDNGMGVPESEINRVFEKGFTGNIGRTNNKSTGLGLYLCKKLCNKLGLFIEIESEKDCYTKVIITFPKGSFSNSKLLLQ